MIALTMNDSLDLILNVPKDIVTRDVDGIMADILCTITCSDLQRLADIANLDVTFHGTDLEISSLGLWSVPVHRNGGDRSIKLWAVLA